MESDKSSLDRGKHGGRQLQGHGMTVLMRNKGPASSSTFIIFSETFLMDPDVGGLEWSLPLLETKQASHSPKTLSTELFSLSFLPYSKYLVINMVMDNKLNQSLLGKNNYKLDTIKASIFFLILKVSICMHSIYFFTVYAAFISIRK